MPCVHRVVEEIDEVLVGRSEITADDLGKLEYIEQVYIGV